MPGGNCADEHGFVVDPPDGGFSGGGGLTPGVLQPEPVHTVFGLVLPPQLASEPRVDILPLRYVDSSEDNFDLSASMASPVYSGRHVVNMLPH